MPVKKSGRGAHGSTQPPAASYRSTHLDTVRGDPANGSPVAQKRGFVARSCRRMPWDVSG